jgi:hypothetical protein
MSLAAAFAAAAGPLIAQTLDPALIRARCETIHQIPDQSILFGTVVDARSGLPLPGTMVHLRWFTLRGVRDTTMHSASAEAADGAFIFCDVPQKTRLTVWADGMGQAGGHTEFFFEAGESTRHDVQLGLRQVFGSISGRLVDDASGRPIAGATIELEGTEGAWLSDNGGRFRIDDVTVGSHEAAISHIAFGRPQLVLTVEQGITTHADIRLEPRAIAVEPIAVEISRRVQHLETNGFYEREDRSLGQFVTPDELARQPWRRFSEVLRTVPGLELRSVCTPYCSQSIRMAGSTQSDCAVTFYIDGRRVNVQPKPASSRLEPRGLIDLDAIATGSDLAAVEVYRGIAQTPAQFYGRCGSIVIWTKRGTG